MSLLIMFLLISFLTSMVSNFFVLRLAHRFSLFDTQDERKIHTGDVPRLGGVGILAGFLVSVVIAFNIGFFSQVDKRIWVMLAGGLLIFIMGLSDDIKPWRARYKLLVQVLAALLVISAGFSFHRITFGPFNFILDLGILGYPLTLIWIVGVTNAVNLIDGIDGLAGSVSSLIALGYGMIFYFYDNHEAMLLCLLLTASIGGFLSFNLPFPKAKLFMGDGGSQYLGFVLAILPLVTNGSGLSTIALPYAAAILLIPVFDTIAAIWRRLRDKQGIYTADKFHLHHKMMMLGFNVRQSLVILSVFQCIISTLVAMSAYLRGFFSAVLLLSVYVIGILFFTIVHIRKEELLEKSEQLDS